MVRRSIRGFPDVARRAGVFAARRPPRTAAGADLATLLISILYKCVSAWRCVRTARGVGSGGATGEWIANQGSRKRKPSPPCHRLQSPPRSGTEMGSMDEMDRMIGLDRIDGMDRMAAGISASLNEDRGIRGAAPNPPRDSRIGRRMPPRAIVMREVADYWLVILTASAMQ